MYYLLNRLTGRPTPWMQPACACGLDNLGAAGSILTTMSNRAGLRSLCALLCGAAFWTLAGAQDAPDAESDAGRASSAEVAAQAKAEPPKTTDRHELSVFYHKRGMANV